jgi:hypothetical protein
MFAGKAFGTWEPIGSPDLVIPVEDYHMHNPKHEGEIIFDFYGWNVWRYVTLFGGLRPHTEDEKFSTVSQLVLVSDYRYAL